MSFSASKVAARRFCKFAGEVRINESHIKAGLPALMELASQQEQVATRSATRN